MAIVTQNANVKWDELGNFTTPATISVGTENNTIQVDGFPITLKSFVSGDAEGTGYAVIRYGAGEAPFWGSGAARGTELAPLALQAGDTIGAFGFIGYDGSEFSLAGYIAYSVSGVPSAGNIPSTLIFTTKPNGLPPAPALLLDDAQNINAAQNLQFASTTTEGLRLNSLTTAQRDAIAAPAVGASIYNADTAVPNFYNGTWNSYITSVSFPFTTVGTGGDYATIGDAIAAGGSAGNFNLYVISSLIETTPVSFSAAATVRIISSPGVIIQYANNNFTYNGFDVVIEFSGGTHQPQRTGTTIWINAGATARPTILENCIINDASSTSTAYLMQSSAFSKGFTLKNVKISLANQATSGINSNAIIGNNVELSGGGASCALGINDGGNSYIDMLKISGTFSSSATVLNMATSLLSNIILELSNNIKIATSGTTVKVVNSSLLQTMEITANGSSLIECGQNVLTPIVLTNSSSCNISNTFVSSLDDSAITSTPGATIFFTNCLFNSAITLGANTFGRYSIMNGRFLSNVTVNTVGGYTSMCNVRAGSTAGAQTFTINATVANTTLANVGTATAIVNNGTNTQIVNNWIL